MVCLYDEEEEERLEKNTSYLKLQMNHLLYEMEHNCLGDMERQPYKQEYLRLEKKLKQLLDN
jgi:hypothetical protein